jgi:hypothetical protein
MGENTHNTSGNKYNQMAIEENELGEKFTVEVTDQGVYFDHNWVNGCLFVEHEEFKELDVFRREFLEEIGVEEG